MNAREKNDYQEALQNRHLCYDVLSPREQLARDVIHFDIGDFSFTINHEGKHSMGDIYTIDWNNKASQKTSFMACRLGCEVTQIIQELVLYGHLQPDFIEDDDDDNALLLFDI